MKRCLYISGETEHGFKTVGGCFKLFDTHGIPVQVLIIELEKHNLIIDWPLFCIDALKSNWTLGKAYAVLREAVGDTKSKVWANEWNAKMVAWCRHRASVAQ